MEKLVKPYKTNSFLLENYANSVDLNGNSRNLLRNIQTTVSLRKFKRGSKVKKINGENTLTFLKRFRKPSFLEKNLLGYSINLGFGKGFYFNRRSIGDYYGDSDYQFLLSYKKELIAYLGFETYPDAILVLQVQGVRGMKSKLEPIKWPNALLRTALYWASEEEIPEVWVLPHERNRDMGVKDNLRGAKFYYDITAKREGFKYDEEKKVFRKKVD